MVAILGRVNTILIRFLKVIHRTLRSYPGIWSQMVPQRVNDQNRKEEMANEDPLSIINLSDYTLSANEAQF